MDLSYSTLVDEQDRLVFRGPNGDIVGATPNLISFVPASQGEFPFSPVDRVTAVVETAVGRRTPLPQRDATLSRALRHAPLSGVVHVAHSRDSPLGEALTDQRETKMPGFQIPGYATGYESARTAISQLAPDTDEKSWPATSTIAYDREGAIGESDLIANVGNLGDDREYVQDRATVRVNCDYSTDDFNRFLGGMGIDEDGGDNG